MLAINTAFMTAYLALDCDGQTILKKLDAESKHSENVLKTIDQMCLEAGENVLDVGNVAVVTGPGSFTGLRIGVAISKALGCANSNIKFVPLSSLELMAYTVTKNKLCGGDFVCVLNALSDLFFVGYYDKNGKAKKHEKMIDRKSYEKITLPKFSVQGDLSKEKTTEICLSEKDLLEFALKKEDAGRFVSAADLEPTYLRLSQAEAQLLEKKKKAK